MRIIISTSLTGSIFLLLVLLFRRIFYLSQNVVWNYKMLKADILLFLLPLGWFKNVLLYLFSRYVFFSPTDKDIVYRGSEPVLVVTQKGMHVNPELRGEIIFSAVWIGIALYLLLKWYLEYKKFKKIVFQTTYLENEQFGDILEQYKKELKLHKKIDVYCAGKMNKTFTTGVFKPAVVLSEKNVQENSFFELKHELVHIKNYDMVWNMLRYCAVCLNWFNPFIYIAIKELERFTELNCDCEVVKNLSQKDRMKYGYIIIQAAEETCLHETYASALNSGKTNIRERVEFIMKGTRKKKKAAVLVLTTGLIAAVSGIPVFAYQGTKNLYMDSKCREELFVVDDPDNYVVFSESMNSGKIEKLPYQEYFTDENGNIYPANPSEQELHRACSHIYVKGEVTVHEKQADGSCKIKYYEAERCTKCGHVVRGKLIRTEIYNSCPH